jgi:hypothetical protein
VKFCFWESEIFHSFDMGFPVLSVLINSTTGTKLHDNKNSVIGISYGCL